MSSEEQHLVENTAELYPTTLYIQKELNTLKKKKKDLDSRKFTRGDTGKTPVDLWQYMRSSRAKVHAGPCKSLTLRWWMTLNIIKSPTNPCGVWRRSLGSNEDFEEPSHGTWWRKRRWERVRDGSLEVTSLFHASVLFTRTAKYLWPAICQPPV